MENIMCPRQDDAEELQDVGATPAPFARPGPFATPVFF